MDAFIQALKDRRTVLVLAGAALALVAGLVHGQDPDEPPPGRSQCDAACRPGRAGGRNRIHRRRQVEPDRPSPLFRGRPVCRRGDPGGMRQEATASRPARWTSVSTRAGRWPRRTRRAPCWCRCRRPPRIATADCCPCRAPCPTTGATAAATPAAPSGPGGSLLALCRAESGASYLPTSRSAPASRPCSAGRCERQGGATYGRWMGRDPASDVPGRVEVSGDNRNFRTLVEQSPSCAIGPVE